MTDSKLGYDAGALGVSSDTEPSLRANAFEKLLAAAAIALLGLVSVSLLRGRADWADLDANVWLHVALVGLPLAITPIQLLRRRGDLLHRTFGRIWALSLFAAAMISFTIRDLNDGGFSLIHILSLVTIVSVPGLVLAARHRRIARHRNAVHWLVTGALLTAGYFTLLPSRILGGWLWN